MTSFNLTLGLRFDLYKPRDANEAFPCPFWHYRTHGTFFNTFIHWKNMYLSWIVHSFGIILVWDFTYIEHEMQLRSSHTSFGTIEPWLHTFKKNMHIMYKNDIQLKNVYNIFKLNCSLLCPIFNMRFHLYRSQDAFEAFPYLVQYHRTLNISLKKIYISCIKICTSN